MAYDLEKLRALMARVENATAPDREFDVKIAALTGWSNISNFPVVGEWGGIDPDGHWEDIPCFSSSIDAATDLIERVLPDANCYGFDLGPDYTVGYVSRNKVTAGHWLKEAEAKTPALALCAAMLHALIATEDAREKEE